MTPKDHKSAENEFANCMISKNGIIEYVGHEIHPLVVQAREEGATALDLGGKVILPSFIDSHMHFLMFAIALERVSLENCKSLTDIRNTITSYAKENPEVPRILCRGWLQSTTNNKSLASMLDDLDPRPIYIDSKDLHSTWCNNAALNELGVKDMPNPTGGEIHRDENGKASGLLSEAASLGFALPFVFKATPMESKLSALQTAIKAYKAAGYTGVIDMAMDEHSWEALTIIHKSGSLPLRVAAHWLIHPTATPEEAISQVDRVIELHSQYNLQTSPDLRIAGIKIITDGVIDACTAHLSSPYSNGMSPPPLWSPDSLLPVIQHADGAGLQCALHAIGDGAITMSIDALSSLLPSDIASTKLDKRHRIEHLELASAKDAKRLEALGITASIQPVHADPAILGAWPDLIGHERCKRAFAYDEFLQNGAKLAIGTDAPTSPYLPFPNLYTGTTRRSARQPQMTETVNEEFKLSLAAAVSAATMGGARSCFLDGITGRLEKGLSADFVVVEVEGKDGLRPEGLLKARVVETWFKGKKVFDARDDKGV